MTRDELVEAGAQAVADTGEVWEGDFYGVRDFAALILDAVEPLIRADEREHQGALFLDASGVGNVLAASIQEVIRADLRAKVEALPVQWQALGEVWVKRGQVLDLLNGGTE